MLSLPHKVCNSCDRRAMDWINGDMQPLGSRRQLSCRTHLLLSHPEYLYHLLPHRRRSLSNQILFMKCLLKLRRLS